MVYHVGMETTWTIGNLAKAAGLPVSTLRYYERIGLLVPGHRSKGNYRLYGAGDVERLGFIKEAQSIGFSLDDIRVLLGLERGTTAVCGEVVGMLEGRLAEVSEQMRRLRRVQKVLRSSLELCETCGEAGKCLLIAGLDTSAKKT